MSKKLENIDIEVNELKGKNLPTWEVIIPKKKSIGLIEKVEGRYRATTTKTSNILFGNCLESSINGTIFCSEKRICGRITLHRIQKDRSSAFMLYSDVLFLDTSVCYLFH